jgi:hypothetical protein
MPERQQQLQPQPTRLSTAATYSRLYFTHNLSRPNEDAQNKMFDTMQAHFLKNFIFSGIIKGRA